MPQYGWNSKTWSEISQSQKDLYCVILLIGGGCCSVAQSCPTLFEPTDCNTPGFPVLHYLLEFAQTLPLNQPSSHLILCRPLLLLRSIFSSIRVFSKKLALHIKWPKHWSFSFSSSLSSEYSLLISFRIDWFDLLAVQGILKSHFQHHNSKASILRCLLSLWYNSHICTWLLEKP